METFQAKQYQIMNAEGKYSTGGHNPHFDKTGFIWVNLSALKSHLALFKYGKWDRYKGCKIVTLVLTQLPEEEISLDDIFDEQKQVAAFNKLKGNSYY